MTDGLPGLALAGERAEPGVMRGPPRPPTESLFARGLWQHIIWVGLMIGGLCIAVQAWAHGTGSPRWQTMVFTVLTFCQLYHVLAIRTERDSVFAIGFASNTPLLGAVFATYLLQLAVVYVPFLNPIFKTEPLDLDELLLCTGVPSLVFFAVELEKWLARRGWIYREHRSALQVN